MEVEPGHGLQESLLLGELVLRLAQVCADGESVDNAAEKVDLIRLAGLDQDVLGLVTELTGENAVGFCKGDNISVRSVRHSGEEERRKSTELPTCGSDGERLLNGGKFLFRNERGMSGETSVEFPFLEETDNILNKTTVGKSISRRGIKSVLYLATEAVSSRANLLNTQVLPQVFDGSLDDRVNLVGAMLGKPFLNVDLSGLESVEGQLVTVEEVRNDGQIAVRGEVISEQLAVVVETEDVGDDDDRLVRRLVALRV